MALAETAPGVNKGIENSVPKPPKELLMALFEALDRNPRGELSEHKIEISQLAESLLPHIQSLKNPVDFSQLIPDAAEQKTRRVDWSGKAVINRPRPVSIEIEKTDNWSGTGVVLSFELKSGVNSLTVASYNREGFMDKPLIKVGWKHQGATSEIELERGFGLKDVVEFIASAGVKRPAPRWE